MSLPDFKVPLTQILKPLQELETFFTGFDPTLSSVNTSIPSITSADIGLNVRNTDTTAGNISAIGFSNPADYQAQIGVVNVGSGATAGGDFFVATRPIGGSALVERLRVRSSGNVGINTSNPLSSLHVVFSGDAQPRGITVDNTINDVYGGSILLRHSRGASGALVSGDSLGAVCFSGYDGTLYQEHSAIIQAVAAENFVTGANYGTDLSFILVKKNTGYTPFAAMRLTSEGFLGIGTSPLSLLHVASANSTTANRAAGYALHTNDASSFLLQLQKSRGTTVGAHAILSNADAMGQIIAAGSDGTAFISAATIRFAVDGTPSTGVMPGSIEFRTTSAAGVLTQHAVLNAAGNLGIGTATPLSKFHLASSNSTVGSRNLTMSLHSNDAAGFILELQKSRGTTVGSHGILSADDGLGQIFAEGSDGVAFQTAASIRFAVDGTPGTGVMPGRIEFRTASATGVLTQHAVLNAAGNFGLGITASVAAKLHTVSITEQLRLGYDGSNYSSFTVNSAGTLTAAPTGNWIFNPTGKHVDPLANYDINLGSTILKYLTLHAAELHVETLVASETMATFGGRGLFTPCTLLTADLAPATTTITVKHNNLVNGDRIYLETVGQVEFMAVTSGASGSGPYTYSVTRNLDGSGANQWYAGDSIATTNMFIDVYSTRGVKAGTEVGPTIAGNVRNSTTYNDWSTCWAIGNLDGLYGYSGTAFGAAFGKYAAGTPHITIDATSGYRQYLGTSVVLYQVDNNGNVKMGTNVAAANTTNILISNQAQTYNSETLAVGDVLFGDNTAFSNLGNIKITGGAMKFRRGVTDFITLDASNLRMGTDVSAAATTKLLIANGAQTYNSESLANGDVLFGDNTVASNFANIKITSGAMKFRRGVTDYITLDSTEAQFTNLIKMKGSSAAIAIGSTPPTSASAGTGIWLDRTGMFLLQANKQTFAASATDGTLKLGSDLSAAATTALVVAGTAVTHNSESLGAGDVLLGDNSSSKANVHWNKSTGKLEFRGGTTVQAYVDTTGAIMAGAGSISLDANGVRLESGSSQVNFVTWLDSGFVVADIGANYPAKTTSINAYLKSADTAADISLVLQALNNSTHGAQIYLNSFGTASGVGDLSWVGITNTGGTFRGLMVGGNSNPNAMLDVRGTGIFTGDLTLENATSLKLKDDGGTARVFGLITSALGFANQVIVGAAAVGGTGGGMLTLRAPSTNLYLMPGTGNAKLNGTAVRGTTEGTNHLDIFDGTAPVGTLSGGISLYSTSGELRVLDAAGNASLLSPHDADGNWIHDEINFKGRRLRVDMERLLKAVDKLLGGGFIEEYTETIN